jgi:hypothetical protein
MGLFELTGVAAEVSPPRKRPLLVNSWIRPLPGSGDIDVAVGVDRKCRGDS